MASPCRGVKIDSVRNIEWVRTLLDHPGDHFVEVAVGSGLLGRREIVNGRWPVPWIEDAVNVCWRLRGWERELSLRPVVAQAHKVEAGPIVWDPNIVRVEQSGIFVG